MLGMVDRVKRVLFSPNEDTETQRVFQQLRETADVALLEARRSQESSQAIRWRMAALKDEDRYRERNL